MSARIVASMWWCGDPVCDCTQPVVERITALGPGDGPPFRFERLWAGTFCSGDTEHAPIVQWRELLAAAERLGAEKRWEEEDVPEEARR
jgi:hypothetical protein